MGGRGGGTATLSASAAEGKVTSAIHDLERRPGAQVGLAPLRERLGLTRDKADETLIRLANAGKIMLSPQDDQKQLGKADRAAAIRFGDRINHFVSIK